MFEYVQEKDFSRRLEPRTMVYVIIHGEPEKDNMGRLSERGRNQVAELAHSRLVVGIRMMYSSPTKATLETSEILQKEFECKIEKRECLNDINLGFDWDKKELLRERIASMWKDETLRLERGESLTDARERIGKCMGEISAIHPADSIVVVTHPLIATLFHSLVTAAPLDINEWLMTGFASCATYEYASRGWTLLMPSDNSFQSNPSSVADWYPDNVFD